MEAVAKGFNLKLLVYQNESLMLKTAGDSHRYRTPFPEVKGAQQTSDKCLLEMLPLLLLVVVVGRGSKGESVCARRAFLWWVGVASI